MCGIAGFVDISASPATGQTLRLEYAGSLLPEGGRALVLLTMSDLEARRRRYVDAAAEDHMRGGIATWQDKLALKQLGDLQHETGISQQALIAEALNMLMAKYNKPAVAT